MVQTELKLDPHSGVTVVFRSKRGDRLKILVWDGTGLVLVYKVLEQGNFAWPKVQDGTMRLSRAQFEALFEGLDWRCISMAWPFVPSFLRRIAAPLSVRRFDGAAGGRRGSGMGTFHRINSEVAGAGASLRSRARYLATNNPWVSQAVANWGGALVGPGIVPTPRHTEAVTRKALSTYWNGWADDGEADGRTGFWGMQADIARGLVNDGEAFVQVITTDDGPRVRLVPPELVDESLTRDLPGGAIIVQGVEFDADAVAPLFMNSRGDRNCMLEGRSALISCSKIAPDI